MFAPSLLGVFINPFYFIRRGLYRGILLHSENLSGRLLDFGCGSKPYKKLFKVGEYVGLDMKESGHPYDYAEIEAYYDGKVIPFDDNHFDCVFSSEVFEHVFNLQEILGELHRVLKPGGHMLITLPFVWEEHEIPFDFARYTTFGIEHLLCSAGFEVVAKEKTTNYVETVFQMWNAYIWNNYASRYQNLFITASLTIIFIAPVTVIGLILSNVLFKNYKFYHNNIFLVKKLPIAL